MKQGFRILLLFAIVWGTAVPATPVEMPRLVEDAFKMMESVSLDGWAYTETTDTNGVITIERFDPSLPENRQWTLIEKDGRAPSSEDLAAYADDRTGEGGNHEGDDLREMVDPEGLELIEETSTYAVYRFRPQADDEDEDDAKIMKHVTGRLKIVKSLPYVESLEIRNSKPFSAALLVKMKEFLTRLTYRPIDDQGHVFPHTVEVKIRGRVLVFKKLREDVSVTYSDYTYLGE